MLQRGFAQLARRAARHTQLPRHSFSSDAFVGNVQSATASLDSQRSSQPRPPAVAASAVVPAQQHKASAASSFMQVVFLGYGVGKFELEMIRGAPQLSDVALRADATAEQRKLMETQAAEVAAKFDLSFVPPPAASAASSARSSWVTDQNASSSMDPAEVARAAARQNASNPQASSSHEDPFMGQMGDPAADPQDALRAMQSLNRPAVAPRSKPVTAGAVSPLKKASDRALPDAMHLVINSSVVVYQNCMFCWSPQTSADITVDSLQFLRVLTPRPDMVLLGSGYTVDFRPSPEIESLFRELGIGLEVMATGNAIATYNILTDEGRTVLAALVKRAEPPPPAPRTLRRSEIMRQKLGYWNFEKEEDKKKE